MQTVNVPFKPIFCLLFATALMMAPKTVLADQDLAKASQNPIGNLISLPFENNTSFSEGPEDATVNTLNLKPLYPVNLGAWNLINRGIFPVIYQGERVEGEGSEFGLGDFTYEGFLSPADPGSIIVIAHLGSSGGGSTDGTFRQPDTQMLILLDRGTRT